MFDFSGKNVIVTGGCGGLGRGIAQAFTGAGARVLIMANPTPTPTANADPFTLHDGPTSAFITNATASPMAVESTNTPSPTASQEP